MYVIFEWRSLFCPLAAGFAFFSAGGMLALRKFWRNFWSRAIFDVAPCLEMRISQLWKFGARKNLAAEFVSSASPERHISWLTKCELHGMFEVPKFCGAVLSAVCIQTVFALCCGAGSVHYIFSCALSCSSIALYYELYQPNCAGLRLRFALSGLRCMAPPYGLRRQHSCEPRPTWLRFVRLLLVCALLCWTWPPGLRCLVGAV